MRKLTYLAALEPSPDGGYGVWFPDLPGCVSYGATVTEAQAMAEEALGLHIYGMEQDDDEIPEASEKLDPAREDIIGCLIVPVSVYPDIVRNEMDNKRVKTNVTLPSWLKAVAEEQHVNYSRILENALMDYLGIQNQYRSSGSK
jgi:predicted RNase H-like HicB family nuclease